MNFNLDKNEIRVFKKLNTPHKIQDFLDTVPINFELKGETNYSPRHVIINNKVHCFEAATFAAAVLWFHGQAPTILDLKTDGSDFDHVVTLFKIKNKYGAISKSNHNVLRWREPVYNTVRELALSFFHEYFGKDRRKILRSYSLPFGLKKFGIDWVTSDSHLDYLVRGLDKSKHILISKKVKYRKVNKIELVASDIEEWDKNDRK